MATWRDVRRIALALPEAAEKTGSLGAAWTVRGKMFAWERPLRRSDLEALGEAAPAGAILAIRTADLELKRTMLLSESAVFFTTPHFDGYAAVLIVLAKITTTNLREVLVDSWANRAPKRVVDQFFAQAENVPKIDRVSAAKADDTPAAKIALVKAARRAYAIKTGVKDARASLFTFSAQKPMYGGKEIARGDVVFIFASENEGGLGLIARGVVNGAEAVAKKRGVVRQTPRVSITVRRTALAKRRLGRNELKDFTNWNDGQPGTELNFKFYRQATNKIVGISAEAAAFLSEFF